ncbi:MAG: hypothetical protein ACK4YO_03625, partial [Candidatus Altarchaeaceae archaeon]
RVENIGKGTAYNLTVIDEIQENVTFSSWKNYTNGTGEVINWSSGRTYYWNLTNLSANTFWEINISLYVNSNVSLILPNQANVTYHYGDGVENETNSSFTNNNIPIPVNKPNLTVNKTSNPLNGNVQPGDEVIYTITVNNTGAGTAYNITINDTLSEGLINVTWNCNEKNTTGTVNCNCDQVTRFCQFNISQMENNTYWRITIIATVSSNATIIYGNYVNYSFADGAGNITHGQTDPTDNLTVVYPNLTITKEIVDIRSYYAPGDAIVYRINITNTGNGTAHNVSVVDIIPNGFIYNTSVGIGDVYPTITNSTTNVTLFFNEILAGQKGDTLIYFIVDTPANDSSLNNTVSVTYKDGAEKEFNASNSTLNANETWICHPNVSISIDAN